MKLKGYITKVLFESDDNDYAIIKIINEDDNLNYVLKGNLNSLNENVTYLFNVKLIDGINDSYSVSSYKTILPSSNKGIIKLLKSYSISTQIINKILNKFNNIHDMYNNLQEIDKLLNDENKFSKFKIAINTIFSKIEQLKLINEKLENHSISLDIRKKAMIFFEKLLNNNNEQDFNLLNNLKQDPKLLFEGLNFRFRILDKIFTLLLEEPLNDLRIREVAKHIIKKHNDYTGNTFIYWEEFILKIVEYIFELKNLTVELQNLKILAVINNSDNHLIFINNRIYLKDVFDSEIIISDTLNKINTKKIILSENIDKLIETFFQSKEIDNFKYSKEQKQIISSLDQNNILLISGGPGTGKSTIIEGIANFINFIYKNYDIYVLTPTGKSRNRLKNKILSIDSSIYVATIHFFIYNIFQKKKIDKNIILIIDEMSMVGTELIAQLFKSLKNIEKIILVGDCNQLNSIQCGNVFNDLLNSKKYKTFYLSQNFRQKDANEIIKLTNFILNNSPFEYNLINSNQIKFYNILSEEKILKLLVHQTKEYANNILNFQIISANKRGTLGTEYINKYIQNKINPFDSDVSIKVKDNYFKINDKVIQLVNNNELDIYNGDFGIISNIYETKNSKGKSVKNIDIQFEDKVITIEEKHLLDIKLAYATTVHKMQGSESDYIIYIAHSTQSFMLRKNLIYTAITRAKNKLMIISEPIIFNKAVNSPSVERLSGLQEKLN